MKKLIRNHLIKELQDDINYLDINLKLGKLKIDYDIRYMLQERFSYYIAKKVTHFNLSSFYNNLYNKNKTT